MIFKTGQAKPNKVIRYKSEHRLPEKLALFSITVIFAAGVCSNFANNVDSSDCATTTYKNANTSLPQFFIAAGKNFLDLIKICKIITLDSVGAFCCAVNSAAGFHRECMIIFSGWGENLAGQKANLFSNATPSGNVVKLRR